MFPFQMAAGALLGRTVVRRLRAPSRVRVVAVGGATAGGSGKTPLAIACASELAAAGARVVLVGHAYRARPQRAREVLVGDTLDEVGDEALLAVRALAPLGARVVVAPTRADAIARASELGDVLVLDGVAQLSPSPATLALLAVDAGAPWGRGRSMPPRGSLRAPFAMLLAACDAIVPVGDGPGAFGEARGAGLVGLGRAVWPSHAVARGAWLGDAASRWGHGGTLMTWATLRPLRVGLLTALGRPERLVLALARRGVFPRAILETRDHGPFPLGAPLRVQHAGQAHDLDLWLATPKCALHVARRMPSLPIAVLDHALTLHPALRSRLRGLSDPSASYVAAP